MKKFTAKKIKNIYLKTYLLGMFLSFLFLPFFAYAATTYSQDIFGLFEYAKDIFNDIILWLIVTGAVIFYMFNLLKHLLKDPSSDESKKYMLYGIITLTLMFTFYAVMALISTTFGIQLGIPQFFGGQTGLTPGSGNVSPSYSIIGR